MLGIAMLTMVRSSRVMKNPSETTSKITHGFPAYLRTSPPRLPHKPAAAQKPRGHQPQPPPRGYRPARRQHSVTWPLLQQTRRSLRQNGGRLRLGGADESDYTATGGKR